MKSTLLNLPSWLIEKMHENLIPQISSHLNDLKSISGEWDGKQYYIHTHTCPWASHLEIQLSTCREGPHFIFFKTPQNSVMISQVQEPLLRAPGSLWPGMLALSPAFSLPCFSSSHMELCSQLRYSSTSISASYGFMSKCEPIYSLLRPSLK